MPRAKEFATIIIRGEEGWRDEPYYCSEGYPTIGWGFRIPGTEKNDPLPVGMIMTREEGDTKLSALVDSIYKNLKTHANTVRVFGSLSDVRQAVLISMHFQLGFRKLLEFSKMLDALAKGKYALAADEAIDSLAAKQAPNRWKRNADMIRSDRLSAYYHSGA